MRGTRSIPSARWIRILAMCAVALAGGTVLAQSTAELKAWDQAEVTLLAGQLDKAVTSLRRATINDPTLRDGLLVNRRSTQELRDALKALETACRQLARKLEAGEDRSGTISVARRIGMLLRDTQTVGRRVMVNKSQWEAIDPAVDLINRLSRYYSNESPLLPRTIQR